MKKQMHVETIVYFFVWISSAIYSVYCFSSTSYNYFRYYKDEYEDFTEGFIPYFNKKDNADIEWKSIMFLAGEYFPASLTYILFADHLKDVGVSLWIIKSWQIFYTTVYILLFFDYKVLLLLLSQPVLFSVVKTLPFNKLLIWITSITSLILLNYLKLFLNNPDNLDIFKYSDYKLYSIVCSLFWMNLKCTSFCIERPQQTKFIDILSYCLYPPTLLSGPFISYKDFECCYNGSSSLSMIKYKRMVKNNTKIVSWISLIEIGFHFMYVNAVIHHPQFIEIIDSWSLYGFGYAMGQYFHLKYVIQYGMSTNLAALDGAKVPHLPRCIGRIHLYSDMWKYFDPGFYNFLLRNIYIPLQTVTKNKAIRSFFCFFFVYFWHGLEYNILIWTTLNYLGIILEDLIWTKAYKKKKMENEQNWKRRINCLVTALLLVMSAISNFYFFAGLQIGNIFVERISKDIFGNIILIALLYCCCQISTELRTVPASKMNLINKTNNNI